MKKRLLAMLLALMLVVGLLPVGVLAADYEVIIQAVVRNEDGGWASTNALTSKNFDGTTNGGTSGGNGSWQWTPSGGGYVLTAEFNSHANSWGNLMHPTDLWEYDQDELKFVGIGIYSYDTVNRYPTLTETILNSPYLFSRQSFGLTSSQGGGHHRTYIFERVPDQPDPPTNPTITGFTKERVITALTEETLPDDVEIELGDINVTYGNPVTIPNGGSVTLLYLLTVSGDPGANFTITDEDAELVGSNCGAALSDDGTITGTIPSGGEALIYVIKEFISSDIKDGHLVNSATIQPGEDSALGDGVGTASDSTPAEVGPDPSMRPDISSVDKVVTIPGGKETAEVGDVLEYTVTITNTGLGTAEDVIVTDTMWTEGSSVMIGGKGGTLQTVTSDGEGGYYVTVDVPGVVDDGDNTVVIYYTYTVQEDDAGTTLKNTVTVGDLSDSTSTPVAEAEEPANQAVRVYAIKNMDKNTAVLIGSAMAAMGDNVFDVLGGIEINYAPAGFENYERTDDLFRKDNLDIAFTEDDVINGWTNVYVNYIGKEQTVQVVIYRNGDTTTPYKTESIGTMRTGETLNIADLDINDYYQTQSGSIRFEFEGWYNDGGWNEYKKGNPDNTLGDSITINGWTNIICMVWDVERVNVQAVVDDDKDAAETIFTGEARRGTNLIDYLNAHTSEMTDYDRVGYIRDQWYNRDWYGHKFDNNSTVNGWTNVYVTYTSDWQPIHVVIYKNGNTSEPVVDVAIDSLRKGETLDTTKLDISEYYTPDKFATGFVHEGWFNDGAWNNYKNAGCPKDAKGLDEIYINGWTNVIAMVWDQFPVYYNIVDENGTVVEEKIYTDTITERDLEDYTFYDASRTGYTFDGWYQDEKDVGDASKLLTGLNKAKKWELYGRYDPIPYNLVIYAAIDKDKDNAVEIYSGMVDYGTPLVEYLESLTLETDVFPGYSPEDGKWYKYDSLAWTFGESDTVAGWTNVLLNYVPNEYTLYYHGNGGVTESGAVQSTSTFKYGSEATIKNNPFTYEGYVFEGWALSADGEVVYTGSEEVQFTENNFPGLLENGKFDFYAVWAEDKLGGGDDGNEPDGTPDYRQVFVKYVAADGNGFVTPSFDTFSLEVDENGKVMTDVALSLKGVATPNADATFAYWTIEGLGYDGGAYSYEADLSGEDFTGYVAGETYTFTAYFNGPVVKPEQPNVYEIYVTVHNGTATFCGSEVTSHILAAENEDITITFTPDEGYTLDYATIDGNMLLIPDDGVYTLKQVDSDHTIEVFYESDKIGTEDPNEGDGVPDKYQATVNFVAGENGEVTGDVTKVYTIFGADGKYAEEGVITPSLEGVTVTPDEGYKVDGWTNAADERVNPESEITVEGGDVVVFTVNFQSDPSLKEITSFEKKLVTDRKTYHSFGLRVPTFIRNGSTVVVDEGKGVTLLYAISLTGTPGAEYAITDTGADVADGYALTGVIPETGVVTVYVTKDFTWREAAAAAYKDDALVNTAAVELTDNPNEPGQESTEEVDVVIDWDDPNVPVVPSDPDDDDDDEDEDDEVFVPNWLNTTDHYSYIVGYEDGTIRPGNNITRAEVATIFFRLLSEGSSERWYSASNSFSDVAADSWYNVPVSTLSNMGIIDGYEDGTFKPNAPITRAEFTAIATRFFDYTAEYEGAFNDVTYSDWYADCVQAAVDMGLVNGYADGGFHPNAYITRAESCAIVNRVLNRVPHEDYLLDEDEMITWPDNSYGAWYYADMQEATNSHDYDWIRVSGEVVEEWTDKLAEPNW